MELNRITPVVLTFDEQENIGRCLAMLRWASDVVVVDSLSGDLTVEIASGFENVRVIERSFDDHAAQWNYGVSQTTSEWVLALDADYILTDELVAELEQIEPTDSISGFVARFVYCSLGAPLRRSLYPPKVILFRKAAGCYGQDGHTQRLMLNGPLAELRSHVLHDDRKPVGRWLRNQWKYAELEAASITASRSRSAMRALRHLRLAPLLVPLYLLFVKGLVLDGRAGLRYVTERTIAELLISLALGERKVGE